MGIGSALPWISIQERVVRYTMYPLLGGNLLRMFNEMHSFGILTVKYDNLNLLFLHV